MSDFHFDVKKEHEAYSVGEFIAKTSEFSLEEEVQKSDILKKKGDHVWSPFRLSKNSFCRKRSHLPPSGKAFRPQDYLTCV